jgi:hypothetical protein
MTIAGDITVLTGSRFSATTWQRDVARRRGQVMMLGSALGVVALGIGHGVNAPTGKKLSARRAACRRPAARPSPDALAEMGRLQKRLETGSRWRPAARPDRRAAWPPLATFRAVSQASQRFSARSGTFDDAARNVRA